MRIKLLIVFWLLAVGSWLLVKTPTIYAQDSTSSANSTAVSPTANPQPLTPNYLNTNPDVPHNLHTYTQSIFIELASSISCMLTGVDPVNPTAKCLGIDPTTRKIGYVENSGGAIGVVGGLIASTFYLPINTHQYGADIAANFGITKQTYAQIKLPTDGGLGFSSLLPTLKMWKAFRNITYMVFTLLFVIIGLGIMFRIKLDPRTVMTIQNQIPRIIMALVFVTFSYAIAGFLVDMMYVTIYLTIGVFAQQGFDTSSAIASNPFGAIGNLRGIHSIGLDVAGTMSNIVKDIFTGSIGSVVGAMIGVIIGKLLPNPAETVPIVGGLVTTGKMLAGGLIGGLFGNKLVGLFAGIVTYLVVVIAIFSALLRLWFILIKSYLYVFLTVVFAPFYIATGVIPGKSGIGSWLRGMVANLAVFPATVVMFLLGKAFIDGFTQGSPATAPFVPPLIGDFTSPDRMASIIGLAVILLTPEIASMVKEALKVTDLKQGAAIGRGLQTGVGVIGGPISAIGSKAWGIDPYNKEPRPATKWLQGKIGRGTNRLSKMIRFGLGTSTNYKGSTQEKEDIARETTRRAAQFNTGRSRNAPAGVQGPLPRGGRRDEPPPADDQDNNNGGGGNNHSGGGPGGIGGNGGNGPTTDNGGAAAGGPAGAGTGGAANEPSTTPGTTTPGSSTPGTTAPGATVHHESGGRSEGSNPTIENIAITTDTIARRQEEEIKNRNRQH